ncbi:MAG: efflux RND transporter periplasmic adaptor subunit [Lutibacter sp.]|nr:efflux RND transporter periplasmic adaptor subunit [Lutibacter sp.]
MKTLDNKQLANSNKQWAMGNSQSAMGRKFLSVAFFLLLILSACSRQEKEVSEKSTSNSDKIQKVEVVKAEHRSFIAEVLITGTALPNQIVTLYAMENGMLSRIRKDIGDKVSQGETIATLENPELLQQQIKWQAEFQAKKANYERLKAVYEKTPALTNIQMVENIEAEYLSAKANLNAVNNRIGFLTIKAPFSGIITKRFVVKGAMIQSGLNQTHAQAIVEIQEINPVRLTIPVPGSDAVGIQKGMDVQVSLPELSGQSFMAKVSRISGALDPLSKTMQVEINLENPDGKILTGMYARVLLQIDSRENILSLPVIAKVSHKNEDYVLVVDNSIVKRIPVRVGLFNKDYFEVLNDDISPETMVIVKGKGLVKPGQMVEPVLNKE